MRVKYYRWLVHQICKDDKYHGKYYTKLLRDLYNTYFEFDNEMDENRSADGIDLRVRFADEMEIMLDDDLYPLDGPCTILEMMVALALRAERELLEDGGACDLFWGMVKSLGLYKNDDYNYNEFITAAALDKLQSRSYQPNGKGGLFTIKHPREDLRNVDIWYQCMWYLDAIMKETEGDWLGQI